MCAALPGLCGDARDLNSRPMFVQQALSHCVISLAQNFFESHPLCALDTGFYFS